MELDTRQSEAEARSFRIGIIVVALLIALVVIRQFYGARARHAITDPNDSNREQALRTGDLYAKCNLAWPNGVFTQKTEESYKKALPWPSAYRRLGVLKESYGQSGRPEFAKLDSAEAIKGFDKDEIRELRREKTMWLRIYGGNWLTPQEARRYVGEVRSLNLGPLKEVAISTIYHYADQKAASKRILDSAGACARAQIIAAICLFALLTLGGMGGIAIATVFLAVSAPRFAAAPRSVVGWATGLTSFVVYLASYVGLSVVVEALNRIAGTRIADIWMDASYLGLVIASACVAYALGMWTLARRTGRAGQDWREIGYRTTSAGRDVLRGAAGFLAALPFLFSAWIVTLALSRTVFKHFPTPEQPFVGIVSQGGAIGVVVAFIAASVVAPIVEETFFRGVLYTTLRGRMGVWPAVMLSSAIFAVIHPLPGGFLPIFVLACVFALMRERTGSLLPSMVCHGMYNTVALVFLMLLF